MHALFYNLEKDISKLVDKYKEEREKEFQGYNEVELSQKISGNKGHGSGGINIRNMLAQIDRETAAYILDNRLTYAMWKESESRQIRPELLAVIGDPRE